MSTPPPYAYGPPPSAYWRGRRELVADLRSSVWVVAVLAAVGVPAGLVWWALAPRATFVVTAAGPEPVGVPSDELLIADEAVFALVLAVVGLVAGLAVWRLRRRRGVATVVAVGLGALAAGVIARLLGEVLAPAPTQAMLEDVGARVTTSLSLGSPAALGVAPFLAVLAYSLAALMSGDDGLGRSDPAAVVLRPPLPGGTAPAGEDPVDAGARS